MIMYLAQYAHQYFGSEIAHMGHENVNNLCSQEYNYFIVVMRSKTKYLCCLEILRMVKLFFACRVSLFI